jgi:hypothetical protein
MRRSPKPETNMSKVNKSSSGGKQITGDMSQDDLLKMQEKQNKESERVTMISNVMAARHQMLMSIIGNLKA